MLLYPVTPLCHCCNVSADCNFLFHVSLCNCFDDCAKNSQAKRNRTDKKKSVGVNATHQETDSNLETILSVHRAEKNILIKGKNQWWHVFCTLQCQIVKHVAQQTKSIPPPLHCQNSTWKSWYFVFPIEFCDLHFIFYMFVYLCHHLFTFAIRQQQEFQGSKVARFEVSRVRRFRADFAWFASVLPVPTNTAREKNVFQKMCVFPIIYRFFVCQTYDLMHAVYPRKDIYRFDDE